MFELIIKCNNFLKDCEVPYAFCGGWALELFMNKSIRPHSDVDIIVFSEDSRAIVEFMINKGWNIYEHKFDWSDNKKANSFLRLINADDDSLASIFGVWAIKPGSSLVNVKPRPDSNNIFDYEIMHHEQLELDFLEIVFCKRKDGFYIYDKTNDIKRELGKTILRNDSIPYLAPEIILFFISDPAYQKSDYHREKNQSDYMHVAPLLPKDNKDWLINALSIMYPEGNSRLEELKKL